MAEVVDFEEGRKRVEESKENPPAKKAEGWEGLLRRAGYKNEVQASLANATLILARSEAWAGVLSFNSFAGRIQILKPPPAHAIDKSNGDVPLWWDDNLANRARTWCERFYDVAFAKDTIHDAAMMAAQANTRHPLRDYLNAVAPKWDGQPRVDRWLTLYAKVPDSPYVRTIGAKWLISAVARAFEPGCKVDYVLIIEGDQRGGKSKVFRALCPQESWFLETDVELGSKDAYHVIENKWIAELAELDSISRGEVSKIKSFISSRVDTYCKRYGRTATDQPRTIVFGGTVNPPYKYLKDDSGGDRWWPARTTATYLDQIDAGLLERDRDQLWAEVVVRYRKGEKWHITDASEIALARVEQEERRQEDPWEETVAAYLADKKRQTRGVSCQELLAALQPLGARATPGDLMRVARLFQVLSWAPAGRPKAEVGGKTTRVRLYRPCPPKGGPEKIKPAQ